MHAILHRIQSTWPLSFLALSSRKGHVVCPICLIGCASLGHSVKFCNSCTCMHVLARHTYVESLHSTHVLYLAGRIEEEAFCPDPMLHEEISDTCREPHGIGCLPPASALRPKVGYQSMQRCDILITGQQPECQLRLEISSITSLRPNNSPR